MCGQKLAISTVMMVIAVLSAGCPATLDQAEAAKTPIAQEAENPALTQETQGVENMEVATFAAGCFWGVEANLREMDGVVDTAVGYCGGRTDKPTYKEVCGGKTGHAEAVQVHYDPEKVSYEALLDFFWSKHNPTTSNRQGPDVGDQYRSAVFYHTPEQAALAEASKNKLAESGVHKNPIVTEITAASTFHRAEEYHQRYLEKRGLRQCH